MVGMDGGEEKKVVEGRPKLRAFSSLLGGCLIINRRTTGASIPPPAGLGLRGIRMNRNCQSISDNSSHQLCHPETRSRSLCLV